jgi:hypothetical protein
MPTEQENGLWWETASEILGRAAREMHMFGPQEVLLLCLWQNFRTGASIFRSIFLLFPLQCPTVIPMSSIEYITGAEG